MSVSNSPTSASNRFIADSIGKSDSIYKRLPFFSNESLRLWKNLDGFAGLDDDI